MIIATASQANMPDIGGFDWLSMGKEVGIGGILGFALGYAAKKALKLALITAALLLLLAVALETKGILTIHWGNLESAYSQNVKPDHMLASASDIVQRISGYIPGSGSFILCFWLGFKKA